MATFQAQVEGLTSLAIDGSSAPTQTELTQFLTDGAKEVINNLPPTLTPLCAASQTFTSGTPNTLNTGKVLNVLRNDGDIDQPCRRILPSYKGKVSDPDEMNHATVTDPVFFIDNNTVDVLPAGGSCSYSEVQYPAVAYGDDAIAVFPDEAEHLVVLYGAIKSLQNVLGSKSSNSAITTALTAINVEIDECLAIADSASAEIALANAEVDASKAEVVLANAEVDKMAAEVALANAEVDLSNSAVDQMDAEIQLANAELDEAVTLIDSNIDTATTAINTAVDRVNTAVQLANTQFDSAVTSNTAEDIELASSHVNAGNGFIAEAKAAISESQGYVAEVSARVNQVNAQVGIANGFLQTASAYKDAASGFSNTAQGYIATANGYSNVAQGFIATANGYARTAQGYIANANAYLAEIQSKINIAQAYGNEVQARLAADASEYGKYEKQQAKLQSDYDKGLQALK